MRIWLRLLASSLDHEIVIGHVVTLNLVLLDVDHPDNTAGRTISVAGKWDCRLQKVLGLFTRHAGLEVCVEVAPNEGTTGSREGPVTFLLEAGLVNGVDLEALVRVPSRADHRCWEGPSVVVNNFSHNGGGRLNGREVAQLVGLNVDVVSHIPCDGARMRRRTGSEPQVSLFWPFTYLWQ